MFFFVGFLLFWLLANLILLCVFRGELHALWEEPFFNKPIVIFESDDWGAGPLEQAGALEKLSACLSRVKNRQGCHPVMTLAVVLSIADTQAIKRCYGEEYHAIDFDDKRFKQILEIMNLGVERKVFTLQLHGKTHYWPDNLIQSGQCDKAVLDWLVQGELPYTEALPSHLQSRWIDSTVLPSKPLSIEKMQAAVAEEVSLYRRIFGKLPRIVVPPTFIWTLLTEEAWKASGIQVIVTPGCRMESRGSDGKPVSNQDTLHNGEKSASGVTYVVRDEYFEPAMGHRSGDKMLSIKRKITQGRPILFETHRFNYVGETQAASIIELERLLLNILNVYPNVQFMSTGDLFEIMKNKSSRLLETNRLKRMEFMLFRVEKLPVFWRVAKLTGLALVSKLLRRII